MRRRLRPGGWSPSGAGYVAHGYGGGVGHRRRRRPASRAPAPPYSLPRAPRALGGAFGVGSSVRLRGSRRGCRAFGSPTRTARGGMRGAQRPAEGATCRPSPRARREYRVTCDPGYGLGRCCGRGSPPACRGPGRRRGVAWRVGSVGCSPTTPPAPAAEGRLLREAPPQSRAEAHRRQSELRRAVFSGAPGRFVRKAKFPSAPSRMARRFQWLRRAGRSEEAKTRNGLFAS